MGRANTEVGHSRIADRQKLGFEIDKSFANVNWAFA